MKYNKKIIFVFGSLVVSVASAQSTQMKIGANPYLLSSPSAVLDLESTNKGFLPPRMTSAAMNSISSPSQGLLVYCTDCTQGKGLYAYNGTSWVVAVSASDATTSSKARASAFVSRGVYVTLGNLRVRVSPDGDPNVSLQISSVSGTFTVGGMLESTSLNSFITRQLTSFDVFTFPKYLTPVSSDSYVTRGDTCIWTLIDRTRVNAWRITLIVTVINTSFFLSIEQL